MEYFNHINHILLVLEVLDEKLMYTNEAAPPSLPPGAPQKYERDDLKLAIP